MVIFCLGVPFTVLFSAVLYVATGIGGFGWHIFDRVISIDVAFWKFSENSPNYASVAYAMTFLMILHSTCTGPF